MKACFFCYKKKKKIVIFKFEVFDESIKQLAKEVASKFPGVTKVAEVEGRGQLEVRGKFSISELTKKLKKIDESVETINIVPGGVTEPEVKIKQQDKGKQPFNIQKASKPLNYGASSSNWTGSEKLRLWAKAKGVRAAAAEEAYVMDAVAAEEAGIGVGAVNFPPNNRKGYYGNKNNGKEIRAEAQRLKELEMERNKVRQKMEEARKRKQAEEEKRQKRIREEKEEANRRKQALADEMKRQKKMKEEEKRRKQALADEEKRQNKIRQEKEEEKGRKQFLAEEEKRQNKIKKEKEDEKRRKQALENNSGGTTQGSMVTGITRSLWSGISTLTIASAQALGTGQPSISEQTQRTGQPSTSSQTQRTGQSSTSRQTQRTGQPSTHFQHKQETRPDEKKGKNGR